MKFVKTALSGVWVVETEKTGDARGSFTRLYCQRAFALQKIDFTPQQNSLSRNTLAGTLRGMHFQQTPSAEQKLVSCLRGKIYDVVIDLRKESPSYRKWFGVELNAENGLALFIPEGLAHGFLTLTDDADVLYQIEGFYDPVAAAGVRWNDPAFGIVWPRKPAVISDRDREWPDYAG